MIVRIKIKGNGSKSIRIKCCSVSSDDLRLTLYGKSNQYITEVYICDVEEIEIKN